MSFTRRDFALSVLQGLGNTNPTQQIIDFLVGWTAKETGVETPEYTGAKYNLLNTTQPWINSTDFNDVHVKNYANYNDGIAATVVTIRNGFYPALNHCLVTNDDSQLTDSPSSEVLHELTTWSGSDASKGYGLDMESTGVVHMNDTYTYGSPVNPVPAPTPSGPTQLQLDTSHVLWGSFFTDKGETPPASGSGIYNSWLDLHLNKNKHMGAALSHEIDNKTWDGKPNKLQLFCGGFCEWVDGAPNWYGPMGKLN